MRVHRLPFPVSRFPFPICCLAVLSLLLLLLPSVAASSGTTIRVGILREQERVNVLSDRPIEVRTTSGTTMLNPGAYEFSAGSSGIDATGVGPFDPPVRLLPAPGAKLYVGSLPYRGLLELRRTASRRLTVINELDLEEYLYGVLKREVDPGWPAEALKAQAVAARTIAVYRSGRFAAEGYDVRATTEDQVYGGVSAEDPRSIAAVDATRGQVLLYQGRPIFAAYHSDSGGATESSEYVWGGRYPYLKGVPDPLTAAKPWTAKIPLGTFEQQLRQSGRQVSGLTAIEIIDLTPSGRAGTLRLTSSGGSVTLKGTDLRAILGPDLVKSTMFTVRLLSDEQPAVEFTGRGAGHGVGLSQWGARGQALARKTYLEILRYYYTGVSIDTR